MDRYVVAGNPVEHSQSPFIHTEFARQTGQAMDYGRALWPLGGFAESLRALVATGAKGCNITVPFKFDACREGRHLTPRAALAQAANVLRFDAEGWLADNTDGAGLVNDIERNAGLALAGKRVLLIGAGGAAAGVLGPLLAAGARARSWSRTGPWPRRRHWSIGISPWPARAGCRRAGCPTPVRRLIWSSTPRPAACRARRFPFRIPCWHPVPWRST